jgi:hypothetical protein
LKAASHADNRKNKAMAMIAIVLGWNQEGVAEPGVRPI